jgi:uncharacterized protein (TIGR04255 family)
MPFPQTRRVVFQKNPLVEVVCQLRFPPILTISSDAPSAFQDRIRKTYPLYERTEGDGQLPKEVTALLAQMRIQIPGQSAPHRFLTVDTKRFISLEQNFVAVSEREYTRWEAFRREIE